MWQYNYDYLCHSSSHKYIDKIWKNGRWQYTYPQDLKGRRDTSDKKPLGVPSIGYKRRLLTSKMNTQNAKDSAYAMRSQINKTAEKAAKQAEKEHSSKTEQIDKKAKRENAVALRISELDHAVNALNDSVSKMEEVFKVSNPRRKDMIEASKTYEKAIEQVDSYFLDLSKKLKDVDYLTDEETEKFDELLKKRSELYDKAHEIVKR